MQRDVSFSLDKDIVVVLNCSACGADVEFVSPAEARIALDDSQMETVVCAWLENMGLSIAKRVLARMQGKVTHEE